MRRLKRNPAAGDGRAPSLFCLAAERSGNRTPRSEAQARRDGNAEARAQAAIVEWVRTVAPDLIIFHVPNGGRRSPAEAARLKWTGVLPGVPDLAILARDGRIFFLEVKAPGGSLSSEQRAMFARFVAMRIPCAIVRSIDDARRAFDAWGLPTREAAR